MSYDVYELRNLSAMLRRCNCEDKTFTTTKHIGSVDKYNSRDAFNRLYEKVSYILTDKEMPQKQRIRYFVNCDICGQLIGVTTLKRDATKMINDLEWVLDNDVNKGR